MIIDTAPYIRANHGRHARAQPKDQERDGVPIKGSSGIDAAENQHTNHAIVEQHSGQKITCNIGVMFQLRDGRKDILNPRRCRLPNR